MNPNRKLLVAAAFAGVLIAPAQSIAQVNGLSVSLFPWGGYANIAKNVNIEDEPGYGGTIGLNLHRYVALEAHYGRFSTETIFLCSISLPSSRSPEKSILPIA